MLDFDSSFDTAAPADIPGFTGSAQTVIDGLSEYEEDEVDELAVESWTELEVGGTGGWLPKAERNGRFLRVAGDDSDGVMLALDLHGPDGDSPFFMLYHDEPYFYLVGRSTAEWLCRILEMSLRDLAQEIDRTYRQK